MFASIPVWATTGPWKVGKAARAAQATTDREAAYMIRGTNDLSGCECGNDRHDTSITAATRGRAREGATRACTTGALRCTHRAPARAMRATAGAGRARRSRCAAQTTRGEEGASSDVAALTDQERQRASTGTAPGAGGEAARASGELAWVARRERAEAGPGAAAGGPTLRCVRHCQCCRFHEPRRWTHGVFAGRWAVPCRSRQAPCRVCA